MIIFLLLFCLFSPTISWEPHIAKLTDSEIAALNAKCYKNPSNEASEVQPTNVSKKDAAPAGLYPFMAFVGKEGQFLCGAVFISSRHLLTVRACLRESNGHGLSLHVGGQCYGENSGRCGNKENMKVLEIDSAIYDDQEWGTNTRDLAILQISDALAEIVAPVIDIVCLPTKDNPFPTSAVVVGWGRMGLSMPPYYLQHVPVELDSDEHDNSFMSIITYARQNRARAIDITGIQEFSQIGRNSSAGNAVVNYSSTSGRYVLHGLLLGSSWGNRFGRVFSDGVKVTSFYSELCYFLQVCGPSYLHPSTAPEVHLTPHVVIPEKSRSVLPKSDEQESDDYDYSTAQLCDNRGVAVNEIFSKDPLATIDVENGAVTLKQEPNQTEKVSILQINTRSVFDGAKSLAGQPQLILKVCPPVLISIYFSPFIALCWNTPYAASNEPFDVYDISWIRSTSDPRKMFKYCNDYNYGIGFKYGPNSKNYAVYFKHLLSQDSEIPLVVYCNPCCDFPLVDSPAFRNATNKDRFFVEHIESLKNSHKPVYYQIKGFRLPMIKLDKGYNVDSVKIKVIAEETTEYNMTPPIAKIYGDDAYACYYEWEVSPQGICDLPTGSECKSWYAVDKSVENGNTHINSSGTETGEAISQAEAKEMADEAVSLAATEMTLQTVDELEESTKARIKASIGSDDALGFFSAKVSTELSKNMAKKTTESTINSIKMSVENTDAKILQRKLMDKKALVEEIEKLHKEINDATESEHNKIMRTMKAKTGWTQQLCHLKHVCHGRIIDTSISNVFSKAKNPEN